MSSSARTIFSLVMVIVFSLLFPLKIMAAPLSVSAVVPANATSFSADLTQDTTDSTVGHGKTITYTIHYGSALATTTEVTLEAFWSRGTIQGNPNPSVDILEYVPGSATAGYGNASPVVDLVHQKISWTISITTVNDQTVSFKLKTSSTLASNVPISFAVAGHLVGPGFTTEDSTLITNFFVTAPAPTSTPTPGPTATPTPAPVTTLTPTPSPIKSIPTPTSQVTIGNVAIRELKPDSSTIAVSLSSPGSITINYGTSVNALKERVSDTTIALNHLVTLPNLEPNITYYFNVSGVSQSGLINQSDIFTLTTGQTGDLPSPITSSLIVASGNTILTNPVQTTQMGTSLPLITIPTLSSYEFRIAIPNSENVKLVQAFLRDTILGLSFPGIKQANAVSDTSVDLTEVSPGIFSGKLMTPTELGKYDLIIKVLDKRGNITEKKVISVVVSRRLTIVNQQDHSPIEDARILLSLWNERTKQYERLRPEAVSILNPSFSEHDGTVNLVLPKGKYKAEISQLTYQSKTVTFSIEDGLGYPEIELKPSGFNLINFGLYIKSGLTDVFLANTSDYLQSLSASNRLVRLAESLSIIIFVILFVLSLRARLQLPLMKLPHYLAVLMHGAFHHAPTTESLSGTITDSQQDKTISGAIIYLVDESTGILKDHAVSDKQGKFSLHGLSNTHYRFEVLKPGYHPVVTARALNAEAPLNIALSPKAASNNIALHLISLSEQFLGVCFEVILFLLVMLVAFDFLTVQSPISTLYLFIGIMNLWIFILYKRH